MANEELVSYIEKERAQGVSEDAIKRALQKVGWKSDDVEYAFTFLDKGGGRGVSVDGYMEKGGKEDRRTVRGYFRIYVLAGLVIAVFGTLLVAYFLFTPSTSFEVEEYTETTFLSGEMVETYPMLLQPHRNSEFRVSAEQDESRSSEEEAFYIVSEEHGLEYKTALNFRGSPVGSRTYFCDGEEVEVELFKRTRTVSDVPDASGSDAISVVECLNSYWIIHSWTEFGSYVRVLYGPFDLVGE